LHVELKESIVFVLSHYFVEIGNVYLNRLM
jgi:hypothetical protein